ncbi:MAG TPA: 1-(5-phosphoribosyl)-5-[(5-phosphoribosylamino)methylideneamino]imidazole-4-carboxamide isomerase [Acidimicrobiia bacterium]|nr:1-(5-phosphoribosyl)-5-[(5-phosphoribosylamino)methylideneamino]imidazole-4-carboxamide isomerase [Acidimicrobiia bacterium]HTC81491.1 1-(5-phosphoribosyl)-5-[(5-phosphoribosylamino)methylideneamino]imidazole-4-carboxamide isomerase [Acidimicrobiia bacterium]
MTELYPAIDLRGGRAVRLLRGDYAAETVYSDDPVAVARSFEAAGARWIHVVDLDAARSGEADNLDLVAAVAKSVGCAVETGGGVRSVEAAERLIDAGIARVVVGTAAVERPELVTELAARFPGRVAVGLDARGRRLAVKGWTETTGADLVDVAQRLEGEGVAALIVTEIGRDGTMAGPDLDQLGAVLEATAVDVIASGGVGTLADITALAGLRAGPGGGRSLAGVIVGRAIYEGRFTVEEALRCLAPV